ncbi:hypothetical protein [Aquimarina spongiae]|uniref:Uncharacterized protein n=1 Tax=Aquimarina spongiae TaxID=570521 RepID=A0A1M6GDH0_9FLAO|nr:hypothetical protein [Aquimarina spongiae]SHJ07988.1 hypothetical protein SAMN04488508_105217 [Aquimarina spongiae]
MNIKLFLILLFVGIQVNSQVFKSYEEALTRAGEVERLILMDKSSNSNLIDYRIQEFRNSGI